jgi:hypothetical protein
MENIICRTDLMGKPAIFLSDSFKGNKLMVWNGKGSEPVMVSLEYYQSTKTPTAKQIESMVTDYKETFGGKEIVLRQRLPRNSVTPIKPKAKAGKDTIKRVKELMAEQTKIAKELQEIMQATLKT